MRALVGLVLLSSVFMRPAFAISPALEVLTGAYELESENSGSCYAFLEVAALPKEEGVTLQFWESDPHLWVAPRALRVGRWSQWIEAQDAQWVSEGKWAPGLRRLVYYDAFMEGCARYPFLGTSCGGDRFIEETRIQGSASGTLLTYNFEKRLFLDPLIQVECEYRRSRR